MSRVCASSSTWACRNGFILRTPLEDNFFRRLLFCTVPCSKFCRNWVSKLKKRLGLQNWARFEKRIFRNVSAARAHWRAGGAQRCRFFSWISGPCQKWPCRCGAEGFSVFSVFSFDPVFENLKWSSSHPRLFLWVFFSFVRILLGIGGNAALHVRFWAVGLRPFLFFWGFWGLLRKALFFPLKKGYLGSFLSVSLLCLPFVLLGVFHLSLSLSLSLSLFLLFFLVFFFLVVFSLFLPSLVFGCFFLSCCFVFVSWEEQHQNITFESFIFIIYVCLFFCFVFQICSYLCFFII